MHARAHMFVFAAALSQATCASAPAPVAPAATPAELPPLPRSSIAAVVKRRGELGLTDEQVREMEELDKKREEEDTAVRADLEAKHKQAQSPPSSGTGGGGAASAPGGMRGGGMGGGMRGGGMRGGGMRGGGLGGRPHPPESHQAALEDRLDENDTKAYLDAENLLTDAQKERAREIASDYREQLYQQREIARGKSSSSN